MVAAGISSATGVEENGGRTSFHHRKREGDHGGSPSLKFWVLLLDDVSLEGYGQFDVLDGTVVRKVDLVLELAKSHVIQLNRLGILSRDIFGRVAKVLILPGERNGGVVVGECVVAGHLDLNVGAGDEAVLGLHKLEICGYGKGILAERHLFSAGDGVYEGGDFVLASDHEGGEHGNGQDQADDFECFHSVSLCNVFLPDRERGFLRKVPPSMLELHSLYHRLSFFTIEYGENLKNIWNFSV